MGWFTRTPAGSAGLRAQQQQARAGRLRGRADGAMERGNPEKAIRLGVRAIHAEDKAKGWWR